VRGQEIGRREQSLDDQGDSERQHTAAKEAKREHTGGRAMEWSARRCRCGGTATIPLMNA
jgi:hypothetical protein